MGKRKARMGRPPKRPADKMTGRVTVFLTPADAKALTADARRLGVSLAEVMRRAWHQWRGD